MTVDVNFKDVLIVSIRGAIEEQEIINISDLPQLGLRKLETIKTEIGNAVNMSANRATMEESLRDGIDYIDSSMLISWLYKVWTNINLFKINWYVAVESMTSNMYFGFPLNDCHYAGPRSGYRHLCKVNHFKHVCALYIQ